MLFMIQIDHSILVQRKIRGKNYRKKVGSQGPICQRRLKEKERKSFFERRSMAWIGLDSIHAPRCIIIIITTTDNPIPPMAQLSTYILSWYLCL